MALELLEARISTVRGTISMKNFWRGRTGCKIGVVDAKCARMIADQVRRGARAANVDHARYFVGQRRLKNARGRLAAR